MRSVALAGLLAAMPLYAASEGTLGYSLQDIGTLGGTYTAGVSINSRGDVTGASRTADTEYHAFLYRHGIMEDLGTLGGALSTGNGINASGRVVGYSAITTEGRKPPSHAFVYDRDGMHDIGTLGGAISLGYGINASGEVTGAAATSQGIFHAFVFRKGTMLDIGTLGGEESEWQSTPKAT
jgi:probable HAF family extracellular repeat protein